MSSTKQPLGYSPTAITTGNNDAIVSGGGVLHGIMVSALGTNPTITVYDSLAHSTGIVIASFVPVVGFLSLDMWFTTGLSIVIGGTGSTNITTMTAKTNTI